MSRTTLGGTETVADTVDPLLVSTLTELFTDACSPEVVRGNEGVWLGTLWDSLAEAGIADIGIAEEAGGSGGSSADAAMVLRLAGRHAVPLPLAEHALLGGWLLAAVGWKLPAAQAVTVAPGRPEDTFEVTERNGEWHATGALGGVAWAESAAFVLAVVDSGDRTLVVRLDPGVARITAGANLAGERRDTLTVDATLTADAVAVAPAGITSKSLHQRGALTRTLMSAGALDAVLDLTVNHAQERKQFGQSLNRFQAVAQRLALLAEEVARAQVAADLATRCLSSAVPDPRDVAVAKITSGEAASTAAKHAHQVHGAIGVSLEYDLQLFTRRLWSWRDEFGGESGWARDLGEQLVADGPAALWPWVSED